MIVRGSLLIHPRYDFLYAQVRGPQNEVLKEQRVPRRGRTRDALEAAGWDLAEQLLNEYCREHRDAVAQASQGELF